ncbi:MAG: DNA mismatch repair endonuclease MutL, partial [Candidatus Aminicenantes bacterium]|nr:DNA mismatch repair endonuclease MutL [Candidatus Aminicenantes bacterium]
MGKIKILPENIANRIAAGEVIEHPASIVKELMENSIDAAASEIRIFVEEGGKRLIRVVDNGEGMDSDDVLLCFERHSTSKINTLRDLNAVKTLGFRGEAFASIAAVTRLTMKSRDESSLYGTQVRVNGGVLRGVSEVGIPRGTSVEARNIFFNTPARRKFLRSTRYELSRIVVLVTHYAISYPGIYFTLYHDDKELISAPPVDHYSQRIYQLYGKNLMENLVPFEYEKEGLGLSGYLSRPGYYRSSADMLLTYVNQRLVKDRLLNRAIREAYHTMLPRDRYPVVLLFITLHTEQVDVNVHPSKLEVRFRQPRFIHDRVRDVLMDTIVREKPLAEFKATEGTLKKVGIHQPLKIEKEEVVQKEGEVLPEEVLPPVSTQRLGLSEEEIKSEEAAPQVAVLGQYQSSYIVGMDREGILIIDQHAAHERILYEKLWNGFTNRQLARQALLIPVVLEVSSSQSLIIEEHFTRIQDLGFGIENFGDRTYIIKEIPSLLANCQIETILVDMVDELEKELRTKKVEDI